MEVDFQLLKKTLSMTWKVALNGVFYHSSFNWKCILYLYMDITLFVSDANETGTLFNQSITLPWSFYPSSYYACVLSSSLFPSQCKCWTYLLVNIVHFLPATVSFITCTMHGCLPLYSYTMHGSSLFLFLQLYTLSLSIWLPLASIYSSTYPRYQLLSRNPYPVSLSHLFVT